MHAAEQVDRNKKSQQCQRWVLLYSYVFHLRRIYFEWSRTKTVYHRATLCVLRWHFWKYQSCWVDASRTLPLFPSLFLRAPFVKKELCLNCVALMPSCLIDNNYITADDCNLCRYIMGVWVLCSFYNCRCWYVQVQVIHLSIGVNDNLQICFCQSTVFESPFFYVRHRIVSHVHTCILPGRCMHEINCFMTWAHS